MHSSNSTFFIDVGSIASSQPTHTHVFAIMTGQYMARLDKRIDQLPSVSKSKAQRFQPHCASRHGSQDDKCIGDYKQTSTK